MSATERLRALLDERGVEYETDDAQVSDTEWYYVTKLRDGYHDRWTYEEPPDCDLLVSYQYDLGAEEAIAATLGLCNDSCNCTNGERTNLAVTLGDADATPTRQGDAVEVVRCRDCKHRHRVRSWAGTDVDECWLHASSETGALGKVLTEPDGFCAWGERKEVGE